MLHNIKPFQLYCVPILEPCSQKISMYIIGYENTFMKSLQHAHIYTLPLNNQLINQLFSELQ